MDIAQDDYIAAFEFLLSRAKGAYAEMPTINGKKPHDFQAYLKMMPRDLDLSPKHQTEVAEIFSRPQKQYFMTAWNLFHRIQSNASARAHRDFLRQLHAAPRS